MAVAPPRRVLLPVNFRGLNEPVSREGKRTLLLTGPRASKWGTKRGGGAAARLHGNGAVPPRQRARARRCPGAGGQAKGAGGAGRSFGPRGPPSAVAVAAGR